MKWTLLLLVSIVADVTFCSHLSHLQTRNTENVNTQTSRGRTNTENFNTQTSRSRTNTNSRRSNMISQTSRQGGRDNAFIDDLHNIQGNTISATERRATRPVANSDVDRTMDGLNSVGNILPSPINQFIQDLRSSMPNLSVGIGASFGRRGRGMEPDRSREPERHRDPERHREPERSTRRQVDNFERLQNRFDRRPSRTMNSIDVTSPDPMMDLRDPFPMDNIRDFQPPVDNFEARFDRNRNRLPDFTSGFGIPNDPWLHSGNVDRFANEPTFLLSSGQESASSPSASLTAPSNERTRTTQQQKIDIDRQDTAMSAANFQSKANMPSTSNLMLNNQGSGFQDRSSFVNNQQSLRGQSDSVFTNQATSMNMQQISNHPNNIQFQGHPNQNMGLGQNLNSHDRNVNQGVNLLPTQGNVHNRILSGQHLPTIPNPQMNTQQQSGIMSGLQLGKTQFQDQAQGQHQLNQHMLPQMNAPVSNNHFQLQNNLNQVPTGSGLQGQHIQAPLNTVQMPNSHQELSDLIQTMVSQAFNSLQVQGQIQNSNALTQIPVHQNGITQTPTGPLNNNMGLIQGQGAIHSQQTMPQRTGVMDHNTMQRSGSVQQPITQQTQMQMTRLIQQPLIQQNHIQSNGQIGNTQLQGQAQGQHPLNQQTLTQQNLVQSNGQIQQTLTQEIPIQSNGPIQQPQFQQNVRGEGQNQQTALLTNLLQQLLNKLTGEQTDNDLIQSQQPNAKQGQIGMKQQNEQQQNLLLTQNQARREQQTQQQSNVLNVLQNAQQNAQTNIHQINPLNIQNNQINDKQVGQQNNQQTGQQSIDLLIQQLLKQQNQQQQTNLLPGVNAKNTAQSNPAVVPLQSISQSHELSSNQNADQQSVSSLLQLLGIQGINSNTVTPKTTPNIINSNKIQPANQGNELLPTNQQLGLSPQIQLLSQLTQSNIASPNKKIEQTQDRNQQNLLTTLLNRQILNQALTIQQGSNNALLGDLAGLNIQALLSSNQNQLQTTINQPQTLSTQTVPQTPYHVIPFAPNEIEIAPPITIPPLNVPTTPMPAVSITVNKTAQGFDMPTQRQQQDQNLNLLNSNLPLEVPGSSKLSPADAGVTQATNKGEQEATVNNFVIKLNDTAKGIRLVSDRTGGLRIINLRAAASTSAPWLSNENVTEHLSPLAMLHPHNETLRKLEATDRINTTDIPEEIELLNGTSLDGPGPTPAMFSALKEPVKTTRPTIKATTADPGEQQETTTSMDLLDFEMEEGISTNSVETTDTTTETPTKPTPTTTTTRSIQLSTTIATSTTTQAPPTQMIMFSTPKTLVHTSLGWLSPFSTVPPIDRAVPGGFLSINDPNMQTKTHEPVLMDILSEVMLGRMKGGIQ